MVGGRGGGVDKGRTEEEGRRVVTKGGDDALTRFGRDIYIHISIYVWMCVRVSM